MSGDGCGALRRAGQCARDLALKLHANRLAMDLGRSAQRPLLPRLIHAAVVLNSAFDHSCALYSHPGTTQMKGTAGCMMVVWLNGIDANCSH